MLSELDTRLIMRPLRNTERVLKNAAVERLLRKEKELGAELQITDILDEVAGFTPGSCKLVRWIQVLGLVGWLLVS